MADRKKNILFIVENDYFPQDIRVLNEVVSLSQCFNCYVIAPRGKNQQWIEKYSGSTCYRFPHIEARQIHFIFIEYLIAAFWIAFYVPFISLIKRIRVIHVANPPDFIIPIICWLRISGIKIIFDMHDLSVETFKGKSISRTLTGKIFQAFLVFFEKLSVKSSHRIIATNHSIKNYALEKTNKPVFVVRNSNRVIYNNLNEINKTASEKMIIGYFGVLSDDEASGLENLVTLADSLLKKNISFELQIIGRGTGIKVLQQILVTRGLTEYFKFYGFIPLPEAFKFIRNFDFGLVTWGYMPKNHLHTAMKIMDYMCCGVPVCSLRLKEQIYSTNGIGIHTDDFTMMADELIKIYRDSNIYEMLRQKTLDHFNQNLAWEIQEKNLFEAYQ